MLAKARRSDPVMTAPRDDWIDQARCVRTADVLQRRGILKTLKGCNGRYAGPCPICSGKDRFGVDLRKGNGGLFHCRHCGVGGGDAISLVRFLDDCEFLCAVETLVGPPPDGKGETDEQRSAREQHAIERRETFERERRECETRAAAELRETIRYCDCLWAQTVPLPPEALAYFARRGIVLDDVPDQGGLRFLARCPFDGVVLPCIVSRFTDAITNAPGGLWRRPITGDKPKSLAPIKGHVIRLWPDEDVTQGLVVGEGVETVLAAATKVTHHNTLLRPAWATGCDDNVRRFPVLPGVEYLTILADNDAKGAGQEAARDCAKRWAAAGRKAEVLIPNATGEDFNDILLRSAS
jgi:phage/plasmid primase-like uncharacterized protein